MAGLRGNQAYVAWAKQTAKGTPNTTYTDKAPFSGGSIAPTRNVANLAETDANRDQGVSYVSQIGAAGAPEIYARDGNAHHVLEAALGAIATAGTTNYTHTLTPANALPYLTLFRGIGATLYEQFDDCKVNELTVSVEAGGPMTLAFDVLGRKSTRLTAEPAPVTSLALASGAVYNFNECTVTLAGGATSLVSSFELTVANSVTAQQTDDVQVYDVVEGQREVTGGFRLIFETLDEYNRFNYGGISGTAQSGTLATVALDFLFSKGVNNSIQFTLPAVAYEEFPVDPDPGGDPIVVDVRFRSQRGASPVVTAVVKNQIAT